VTARTVAAQRLAFLLLVSEAFLSGCSGESEPTVGDAPIAKGMVRQAPKKIKPPTRSGAPGSL